MSYLFVSCIFRQFKVLEKVFVIRIRFTGSMTIVIVIIKMILVTGSD